MGGRMWYILWAEGKKETILVTLTDIAYRALKALVNEQGEPFHEAIYKVVMVCPGCSVAKKLKSLDAVSKEIDDRSVNGVTKKASDEFKRPE